jgi:hypothetical protein
LFELEPVFHKTEVMVGSAKHGFAGRYDVRCEIDGQICLLDLKTGKGIYDAALLQLAGYELASVEMGEEPVDRLVVLRLGADGKYETKDSHATLGMFLGVKAAYDALKALQKAQREALKNPEPIEFPSSAPGAA